MEFREPDVPALRTEDVCGAQLFANRLDLLISLVPSPGATIVEVGVAFGDFSELIIQCLNPRRFVAIDSFRLHEQPEVAGRSTGSIFGHRTHIEYYRDRFAKYGEQVLVEEGVSWEALGRFPNDHFDLVYIDAAHDYSSVKKDTELAVRKVSQDGTVVFNDYIMYDHIQGGPYGVVPNVNELVVGGGWRVVGLALHPQLFCDIALRRAARGQ